MNSTKLLAAVLAVLVATTGVAAAGSGTSGDDTVRIIDEKVTIGEATITVSDTHIEGPGLVDRHIEDRTYTFSSTIHVMSLDITVDGTTYLLCDITIDIEGIGVHLEDVSVSSGQ